MPTITSAPESAPVCMISKEQPVFSTTHIVPISALVAFSVLTSLPLVAVVRARMHERDARRQWDAFELGLLVANHKVPTT